MMSKGFITEASLRRKGKDETDNTNLQIEDLRVEGPVEEGEWIIDIYIEESGDTLSFTLSEAEQHAEAFTEIVRRYKQSGNK